MTYVVLESIKYSEIMVVVLKSINCNVCLQWYEMYCGCGGLVMIQFLTILV